MSSWSAVSAPPRKSNYKVRFRHGVFPDVESQATRADIKKYDYFFGDEQRWVGTPNKVDFVHESTLVADDSEVRDIGKNTGVGNEEECVDNRWGFTDERFSQK
ncbi:hypothetical protein PtrM4_027790 [Pyrenophora tritici-repentis]|uniref:Uncharacterized protein n=1 Tax=Pyrenophora tritici-repentis TaxID=45151 RepID=A0A834S9X9_9PLEO|nr:hypothetical protein PtrM4_027790 [Pyrenophora tritici-repentis]